MKDTLDGIAIVMLLIAGGFGGYIAAKKETLQECARTGEAALVWGATIKCEFVKK